MTARHTLPVRDLAKPVGFALAFAKRGRVASPRSDHQAREPVIRQATDDQRGHRLRKPVTRFPQAIGRLALCLENGLKVRGSW